jgi:hypothetical protein
LRRITPEHAPVAMLRSAAMVGNHNGGIYALLIVAPIDGNRMHVPDTPGDLFSACLLSGKLPDTLDGEALVRGSACASLRPFFRQTRLKLMRMTCSLSQCCERLSRVWNRTSGRVASSIPLLHVIAYSSLVDCRHIRRRS